MEQEHFIENLESHLIDSIAQAQECYIAVALTTQHGLNLLSKFDKNCTLKIVTGINLPTPLEVLKELKERYKNKARIFREVFFHPKVYLFKLKDNTYRAYVGSANFTQGGLTDNIEFSISTTNQIQCRAIKQWFDEIFNKSIVITEDFLRSYESYSLKCSKRKREQEEDFAEVQSNISNILDRKENIKDKLIKLRNQSDYEETCNERRKVISKLKVALDYDNHFENINLDEFLSIPELGRIRLSYKLSLKEALKSKALQKLFTMLCDESLSIETRYKKAMKDYKVVGCGKNIITKILVVHNPEKYFLWNKISDDFMNDEDLKFERGTKDWTKYQSLCSSFKSICNEIEIDDFSVVDALLYKIKQEQ